MVITNEQMQEQPIDGQKTDAEPEFVVLQNGVGELVEHVRIHIVLSIDEENYPRQNRRQYVHDDVIGNE